MYKDTALGASSLVVIALAHALSLFAAVASSINVSGGHVNPAVTFGALVGGRVSVLRAIYYWIAQLLGAVLAAILLRLATDGLVKRNRKTHPPSTLINYLHVSAHVLVCL